MSPSIITVLGGGYVGLTTAALLANAGYVVYLIEPNDERRASIARGKSFFHEDGIDAILAAALNNNHLTVTNSYKEAIPESDIVFSCVGTPDNPDGTSNLTYVHAAALESAKYLKDAAIYVQKSTVPVGTGKEVSAKIEAIHPGIQYVSNPEFLREGTAIYDTLFTDRIVVGGINEEANKAVIDVYTQLFQYTDTLIEISGLSIKKPENHAAEILITGLESAELIKVTANAFLALKISFANSIAKLADVTGADITQVMDGVGIDKRINRAFLNAGRGYGGGCFPKDVSGLITTSQQLGIEMPILTAAQEVNESMPAYVVEKLKREYSTLLGLHISLLGLAFKAGTSDVRKSPGITIANLLVKEGAVVAVHDPAALTEAKKVLTGVTFASTVEEALKGSSIALITTEWSEYSNKAAMGTYSSSGVELIVDAVNQIDSAFLTEKIRYIGIGR